MSHESVMGALVMIVSLDHKKTHPKCHEHQGWVGTVCFEGLGIVSLAFMHWTHVGGLHAHVAHAAHSTHAATRH